MIKVNKSAQIPAVLAGRGVTERERICADFASNPSEFISGVRTFEFKSAIYGHKSVKDKLIEQQHGKCFLCESSFRHVAHGDVEHFRPKGGFQQTETDELGRPGYYWLAYDWNNMFLSCQLCNQQYKKNFFPLRNPQSRARTHTADLAAEKPLLINPAIDDPQKHISFRAEVPYAVRNSRRGKATIDLAGLNRPALGVRRANYYRTMKAIYEFAQLSSAIAPGSDDARALMSEAVKETEEYASMIQSAIKARFRIV